MRRILLLLQTEQSYQEEESNNQYTKKKNNKMDPHFDDELKEYLRLIDATVKSATTNHVSPQKMMQQSTLLNQFISNELFQGVILMNSYDEKDIKKKKPQLLDDSISDWNIGSNQTTLESPKSQDDIKDMCGSLCFNGINSQNMACQNHMSINNGNNNYSSSQKSRFFQDQQRDEHFSCLCVNKNIKDLYFINLKEQEKNTPFQNLYVLLLITLVILSEKFYSLDASQKPSRNIVVQLGQQDDIEQFISFIRSFGDLQNIDRHKYQSEKIIVISFYNLASSIQAFSQISSGLNAIKLSYLNDFNDFDYIDYMLVSNANSFNQKLVLDYLGCFGKILEYSSINSKLVIRYFDVRSLREIDRLIKLQEKDRKSFVYLHRVHFPEVEEKFIFELLKNIFIFSKENTTDIILKNARVKSNKNNHNLQQVNNSQLTNDSFQTTLQNQQQKTSSSETPQINSQQINIGPISPSNASSPPLPNFMENSHASRTNLNQQQVYFNTNQQIQASQQNIGKVLTNFFNFDENTNLPHLLKAQSENSYSSIIDQQIQMNQIQNQQSQMFGGQQSRQELSEICDYQNFFISQMQPQKSQSHNSQNKFMQLNSTNNNQNESCIFNNESENLPYMNYQNSQQKRIKKMNPNANNFTSLSNYNNNNSNNNCSANINSLQQQLSNLHITNDNNLQQKAQFIQQISQSSSSSLSSTNFPQYNQGNLNSMRISQDENPFSASSLRMSFDNNPAIQMNNSFYSNGTSSNSCNNNNNINNNANFNNNKQQQPQLRSHNSCNNPQQSQFMNLLNCNNQFMNDMRFCGNNISNIGIDYDSSVQAQIQNGGFNQNSHIQSNLIKHFNNNSNGNFQQQQQQANKVCTILGSNGAKFHTSNQNFQVSIENILNLKDRRATIMVRNIPNRYNQDDFLRIIDINFKGLYDFVYLPMDFKNHCNIGYAFINFIDPKHIIPFYNEFNGKRWEMIRSEKVCFICYARIQGRNELIAHFKKSGVMSALVDKSFKPLILPNPQLDLQILQQ